MSNLILANEPGFSVALVWGKIRTCVLMMPMLRDLQGTRPVVGPSTSSILTGLTSFVSAHPSYCVSPVITCGSFFDRMLLAYGGESMHNSKHSVTDTNDEKVLLFPDKELDSIIELVKTDPQRAIPAIAKNNEITAIIEQYARSIPTTHKLLCGDSRIELEKIPDESVHLIVTSPPYWTLKQYPSREGQMGSIEDYEKFLHDLDKIWKECYRVLVPGGRMAIVVGDVCLPRRRFGRHVVYPLHASIQEHCRAIGFDNLAPIIWYKISNAKLEATGNGSSFLGKPYEPNAVIKNDIEFILFQRKPGGYRKPTLRERVLSIIPRDCHKEWFQQIWTLNGASTKHHPAPYPLALAERLVRMFSFVGDTVLDPFMGTGTTNLAAALWGRNSIGIEIEPTYYAMAKNRLEESNRSQITIFGHY